MMAGAEDGSSEKLGEHQVIAASMADLAQERRSLRLIVLATVGAGIVMAAAAGATLSRTDGADGEVVALHEPAAKPPAMEIPAADMPARARTAPAAPTSVNTPAATPPPPEAVLAARMPRPRPDEPMTTGSIEPSGLAALIPVDAPGLEDGWSEASLRVVDGLRINASIIAESSPECDRVVQSGLSSRHSNPPDRIFIVVHCENGTRFVFTRADLEANAPRQESAGAADAYDRRIACVALSGMGLPFPFPDGCDPNGYGFQAYLPPRLP